MTTALNTTRDTAALVAQKINEVFSEIRTLATDPLGLSDLDFDLEETDVPG